MKTAPYGLFFVTSLQHHLMGKFPLYFLGIEIDNEMNLQFNFYFQGGREAGGDPGVLAGAGWPHHLHVGQGGGRGEAGGGQEEKPGPAKARGSSSA